MQLKETAFFNRITGELGGALLSVSDRDRVVNYAIVRSC